MTHKELMNLFLYYCKEVSFADINRLLRKHFNDIDLTYRDGEAFIIAGKKSSVELMTLLLNHYNSSKLQGDPMSDEYQQAYTILQDILIEVQSQCEISGKMQEILDNYHIYKIEEVTDSQNTDTDSRNDEKFLLSDDQLADSELNTDTTNPKLIGETEINNTLLLTFDNLVAKSYRYMILNIEAIDCFKNNDTSSLTHIINAATLVTTNNNKTSNIEYKSIVLYNYLKFHQKFTHTIPKNKLGVTVINQIENFFKEQVVFIATKDANSDVLNILLSKNDFVHFSDQHGQTPLHWASDNPEITKMLVDVMSHEDILKQAEGNNSYTAMHLAIHHKNVNVVGLLLNKAPELANIQDKYGQTPLHWASDNPEITKMLIDVMSYDDILKQAEGNNSYTAMHLAIHHKNVNVVELLLNKAPELTNIQDRYEQTPLHWASDNSEITEMILNTDIALRQSSSTEKSTIDDNNLFHDNVELAGKHPSEFHSDESA